MTVRRSRLFPQIQTQYNLWINTTLLSLLFAAIVPLAAGQSYRITDLGTFSGGTVSQGDAINTVGQVAGYARFSNYNAHAILFSGGRLQDLGAIPPESNFSVGQAINTEGAIVGYTVVTAGFKQHATLWSQGAVHDLGTLAGGDLSQANGINDLGTIAGFSNGNNNGAEPHAVIWPKSGPIQDLGTLPGGYYSQGLAINIEGEVAGYSNNAHGNWQAIVWTEANGMQPLPFLNKLYSASANAINDRGDVAGGSGSDAVLWQKSNGYKSAESLGTLSGQGWSSAFAINNFDEVVGWSGYIAFIWTRSSGMQDLNKLIPANSGWQLLAAYGINDLGQITGQGNINGQSHGFLLTPVHDSAK